MSCSRSADCSLGAMKPASRSFFIVWAGAAFLPFFILFAALAHIARDVPMFDDYPAILFFDVHYGKLPTLAGRLTYLIRAQTGDYKLIVAHAFAALDLGLTHHIHLKYLIWTGNLFGFAIILPLWGMYFKHEPCLRRRLLLFLPILYLFFQMNYVENYDWAMCGLQTFPVVLFSLSSLVLVARRDTASTLLACICACLAGFSSSNGFLLAPIGALVYLRRKEWIHLSWWLLTFGLAITVYLYGYRPLPNGLSNENTTATNRILFLFSFLGSAAENQHRQPVKYGAVVLGLCVTAIILWAFFRRFHRNSPAACYTALWVLLTAVPVLVYRLPAGFQYSLIMRYKIYSDLLLIFCYGFLATHLRTRSAGDAQGRLFYGAALTAAIGCCAASDIAGYRFLVNRQQRVAVGLNRFALDPTGARPAPEPGEPMGFHLIEADRRTLAEALQSGIYTLPPPDRR